MVLVLHPITYLFPWLVVRNTQVYTRCTQTRYTNALIYESEHGVHLPEKKTSAPYLFTFFYINTRIVIETKLVKSS